MTAIRPRRSMLYVPGSNARAMEKARTLPVDGVILDLEDAVAPAEKAAARQAVAAALAAGGFGRREVLVRINPLGTAEGPQDAAALARAGADGIVLPKVETPAMLHELSAALDGAGAPADLALWAMLETPRGILAAEAVAGASPRLAGLILGLNDLAKDLHADLSWPGRAPFLASLSLAVLAARAHGRQVLDAVHPDLEDDEGFAAACAQGRAFGFDGKTLIHPKTVAAANAAFAPRADELERAGRIRLAHAEALAAGRAVVLVDGRLVEALHVAEADRLLALAQRIAEAEDAG